MVIYEGSKEEFTRPEYGLRERLERGCLRLSIQSHLKVDDGQDVRPTGMSILRCLRFGAGAETSVDQLRLLDLVHFFRSG